MGRRVMILGGAVVVLGVALFVVLRPRGPLLDPPPLPDPALNMDVEVRDAIQQAHDRISDEPRDAQARATFAMLCDAAHLFREAETAYEQAVALEPDSARWWYLLACAREELGESEAAMSALERAASLDATQFIIPVRQGMWLLNRGEPAPADAAFRRALQLKPDSVAAKYGLARALAGEEQYAQAAELFEQLRTVIPTDSTVHQLLGRCYMKLGRRNDADAELALGVDSRWNWTVEDEWTGEVLSMRRGYRARFEAAKSLFDGGAPARAVTILEELRVQYPDDIPAALLLCSAYDALGQSERGLNMMLQLDARRPDHFALKLNISHFYQLKGDMGRAMRFVDAAIQLHPKLAAAHVQKARLLLAQQDIEQAELEADEALRCDAGDEQAQYIKAQALITRKRFAEAVRLLEDATRRHPAIAQGFAMLAVAQYNAGQRSQAVDSLDHAERLNPNDPMVRNVREGLNRAAGNPSAQGNR